MKDNNIKTIIKSSYKPQREFEQDISKLGYSYDPELSTMENKVFYDPKTKKASIAYRGSTTVNDWIGNVKLGLGFKDPEAEKRIQLADKVKSKYGDIENIYGHSRGGYIAEKAGEKTGANVITYNKATLPEDIFKNIRPQQTDIRTKGDIVSLPSFLQTGGQKKEINSSFPINNIFSAHSTENLNV
jgi:hypothetical protein